MKAIIIQNKIKGLMTKPYTFLGIGGAVTMAIEYQFHYGNFLYALGAALLIVAIEWAVMEDLASKLRK